MEKRNIFCALALSMLLVTSCSEKKETRTIITTMEETPVSKETQELGNTTDTKSFEWSGSSYNATITRTADHEQPVVKDSDGNKYYDNRITLTVEGPDGAIFNRTFTKDDFSSYIDSNYLKPSRSALMSIAFNRVDGGNAIFTATVGSPCTMDDEYMLVQIQVSKAGGMSMQTVMVDEE